MSALGQKRTSNILRSTRVAGLALYRFVGFGHGQLRSRGALGQWDRCSWIRRPTIMPRGAVSRGSKARLKTPQRSPYVTGEGPAREGFDI